MSLDSFVILNLMPYFNGDAISFDDNPADGLFGVFSCYPAEELPESNSKVYVNHVPFQFPPKEDGNLNTIECNKQSITIETGKYKYLYCLGACDNGDFEERLEFVYDPDIQIHEIGLSDWIYGEAIYGDEIAIKCSHTHSADGDVFGHSPKIWFQRITLDDQADLSKINLPDNPCFHIFAITLERGEK